MRTAVYAGSFDPVTKGHEWMIERGAALFDRLEVVIAINSDKKPLFSGEERLEMVRTVCRSWPNCGVSLLRGKFLASHARAVGAGYLLRGIRPGADFDYEHRLRQINSDIESSIETVFLIPPRNLAEVSSSTVKSFLGLEDWEKVAGAYVSPFILEKLKHKL